MACSAKVGFFAVFPCFFLGLCLCSCGSGGAADAVDGLPIAYASPNDGPPLPGPVTVPEAGPSCVGGDSDHICLALKYVVYEDSSGTPVVSQSAAVSNVETMNQIWSACDVGFQMDRFVDVNPAGYGLAFSPANTSELDLARQAFQEANLLLVVTTGVWNRSGTLGDSSANAWTNMPGSDLYGSVAEAPVGAFGNIFAHELGHYMNLSHVPDAADLMDPIIYSGSNQLSPSQCSEARAAANSWWQNMNRG